VKSLARTLLTIVTALTALLAAPALAFACPTCGAGQQANVLRVVAVFIAVPFVIVGVVVPAIVRAVRSAE